ncbi:hypothetical protein EON65_35685 [archaeon]|nr:MAG: hypothetical protein EON65_35685 [archaeon]
MQHDGYRAGKLLLDKAHRKSLEVYEQGKMKLAGIKDKGHVKDANGEIEVKPVQLKHDEEFCLSIQQLVIDAESESYFEHMGDYLARICELARKHTVRLDSGYFKIAMALKVAEGISLALGRWRKLIVGYILWYKFAHT